jgi:hypothetical protein
VFTVLATFPGMEREYIRDRTLEGHESARKRADHRRGQRHRQRHAVMARHLRDQDLSLRDIGSRAGHLDL